MKVPTGRECINLNNFAGYGVESWAEASHKYAGCVWHARQPTHLRGRGYRLQKHPRNGRMILKNERSFVGYNGPRRRYRGA